MKNKIILFLNLVLFGMSGLSQKYEPFISDKRQWKYVQEYYLTENSSQPIYIVTIGYFNEDTLIENSLYKKYYHKSIIFDTTNTVAFFFTEDTINQKVFVRDPLFNKTVLLYDFSISEGDSFNRYIINNTYMRLKVIKVDTFFSFNKSLKRILFNDSTTWIEGIGDITSTRIPSYGQLICVKDNESVLYLNENYNNCDTIFPQGPYDIVSEIMLNENICIFPNPIDRASILEVRNSSTTSKIELYNNIGILVKSEYFVNKYPIGEINLPKGIFIYRVINHNSIIGSGKILIK
jgi:hypothetical protein